MELHRDIGTAKAGSMCPNNPLFTHGELFAEHDQQQWLIERAQMCARLPGELHDGSPPIDVTMASIYRDHRDSQLSGLWPKPSDS
jgi:hypothetical protein